MSLTLQEARCVEAACRFLGGWHGGQWEPDAGPTLDELHPSTPSPEVILRSGTETAAVEVKRLTGDSVYQTYLESWESLRRSLVPSCGGSFLLMPPTGFSLPIDRPLRRHLKTEIGRIAPGLQPGDEGAVSIRRQAVISLSSETGPGTLRCCHSSPPTAAGAIDVSGQFFLVDCDQWEHAWITEQAKERAKKDLEAACRVRLADGLSEANWQEEWALRCNDRDAGKGEVALLATTAARDLQATVDETVYFLIDNALRKFTNRRWARRHILVLERVGAIPLNADRVGVTLSQFDPNELLPIDLVLHVDGDQTQQVWPRP